MKLRTWIYFFKTGLINISNERLIHLISIGTITISILLFGSFLLLYTNLNNWIRDWGESLSMSVYIQDGIQDEEKNNIEKTILSLKGAEIKEFITKEKALADLKKRLGDQAGLMDGLRGNPFPASFEVIFNDVNEFKIEPQNIKKKLEKIKGVDEVQYSEQWADRFEGLLYVFKVVGLIIGGLLCIAVLFIISNTIKLTIYSRRNEIEIQKLVGATDWFVKIPFLIEGAIQGLISGIIAFLVLFLAYCLLSLKTIRFLGLTVLDISFLSLETSLLIILLGLFLGIVGGLVAIGRFFKP